MRYESERDVELRLRNSVVMFNQRPVLVNAVENRNIVIVEDMLTGRSERAEVNALDLSPDSAKLGYVIAEGGEVYFAMRKPTRRYKQGLTTENFLAFKALEKPSDKEMANVRTHLHPFNKYVARTILGQFPDMGEAFQKVRDGRSRIVPFHREWAVAEKDDELSLLYRGDVVGYVGDRSVKLIPERFYLKEVLELCLM